MIQPNQICLIVKLYNNRPELLPDSNDLGYVNYDLDYPAAIKFVPEGETLDTYRRDYNDNMVNGYIYGFQCIDGENQTLAAKVHGHIQL